MNQSPNTTMDQLKKRIHELEKAEQSLREREFFLRSLLDAIPVPVFYKDTSGRYMGFNKRFETFLEKTRDQLVGKTVFEVHQAELAEIYHEKDMEVFQGGGVQEYEFRMKNHDGFFRETVFHKAAFRDSSGNVAGLVGVISDITERKAAETALREKEERCRTLANNIPDIIYSLDAEGRIVTVNKPSFERYGYREQDIKGKPFLDFIHPEDHEMVIKSFFQALEQRRTITKDLQFRIVAENGSIHWMELNSRAGFDQNGNYAGESGVLRDITDRKQVSEKIQRYEFIANTASEYMTLINRRHCLEAANDAYCRAHGLSGADIIGRPLVNIWGEAIYRKQIRPYLDRCFAGETVHYEACFPFKGDREQRFYQVGMYPYRAEPGGPVTYAAVVTFDITGRKQAEEEKAKLEHQLHQAQKMESIGRLAGGVAHDFNNMIGVILANTEMALDETGPDHPAFPCIEDIKTAALRSSGLTRQLLAFARKQTISPRMIDLNDTIGGMLKMLQRLIGENIELGWRPGDHLWPVKMDPSQIDQILANLCVNARDAIDGHGNVVIETRNEIFNETYCDDHPGFFPGRFVLLAVSDNGSGMDKDTLANVFEPFFTTKEPGKGTGMGLATIYGIVKQNNGFINVYSEPGHGTTFKIYLPRHSANPPTSRETGEEEPARPGHETILLVEDEIMYLQIIKRSLLKLGYKVLTADTPGEAMNVAAQYEGNIHLLMTDVVMPEMNGRALAKKIMTLYPDIKSLFMSGYTADVIAHQGILDPGVQFIHKPFSIKDLAAKVRAAMDEGN